MSAYWLSQALNTPISGAAKTILIAVAIHHDAGLNPTRTRLAKYAQATGIEPPQLDAALTALAASGHLIPTQDPTTKEYAYQIAPAAIHQPTNKPPINSVNQPAPTAIPLSPSDYIDGQDTLAITFPNHLDHPCL